VPIEEEEEEEIKYTETKQGNLNLIVDVFR
jgi:hypothetical protein